jgi:sugar phosphate isomerase/epimerase
MNNIKKALQLYTLRFDAANDLYAALALIKGMGYDGVEFCGLFGHDAEEIRGRLDGMGLAAVSDHVTFDMLANHLEDTIRTRKALGCQFIVLGFLEEVKRHYSSGFPDTLSVVRKAAAACRQAGLPLAYHNHNFEFTNVTSKNGLEQMLDGVPDLDAQFDSGWMGIMGQDPVAMLQKYAGRYASVHLKDYLSSNGAEHDFCPVGLGVMDNPAVINAAIKGGARWLIVDQDADARRTATEAARLSVEYLVSLDY